MGSLHPGLETDLGWWWKCRDLEGGMWGGHKWGVGPALGLAGYLKCLQQLCCVKKATRQGCTESCAQRPDARGTGMTAPLCGSQVILSPSPGLEFSRFSGQSLVCAHREVVSLTV